MSHRFFAVNQFHSGLAVGDAVTTDMLEIQRVLRDAGYPSRIFGEHIGSGLEGRVAPLESYEGNAKSLLIVHHSMGFDVMKRVIELPDRKILKYHNITPPEFLRNNYLRSYALKGRSQLADYRWHIELALGDSEYNRAELQDVGYRYTGVLPIFFRASSLLNEAPSEAVLRRLSGHFNLLFVGRIVPNKAQIDLVRIFDEYHSRNPNARLYLVGSTDGCTDYTNDLISEINGRNLKDAVFLTGKVSSEDLAGYYSGSQVLVCASEHEGFCVPLLEAMSFDLPVVACAHAAVPETLGRAGILLDIKDPHVWSEVLEEVRRSAEFKQGIVAVQRERLTELAVEHSAAKLLEYVGGLELTSPIQVEKPTLQVQGPFESSYSLAMVNRNLAEALDTRARYDSSIYCTEGPGDYEPNLGDLADKPIASWLWQKSRLLSEDPDIVVRNLYPPRVRDTNGRINFLHFFWEDSVIPPDWVSDFNRSLDGLLAPTKHVQRVAVESGVRIPVHIIGTAVDNRFFDRPFQKKDRKNRPYTFLNISSGFPRKGIDVLLAAYFSEFTGAENVRLVIKTFPNCHNTVVQQIEDWKKKVDNSAHCVHIDCDLSVSEIDELYAEADCLVYPSRAEGFGLPIAEAMAQRIPTIVTNYSGQTDFCSPETAFLVGYELVDSESHFGIAGAKWAEPNLHELRAHMRFVHDYADSAEVGRRVDAAYAYVSENLRWNKVADRAEQAILSTRVLPERTLGMVTSWNERCGIAEYSRYLLEALGRTHRRMHIEVLSSPGEGTWNEQSITNHVCWRQRPHKTLEQLRNKILSSEIDIVHFQFNFGFFDLDELGLTIDELKHSGRKVVVTFHSTAELQENGEVLSLKRIASALRSADLLLVHSSIDERRLASFGISENVKVFPHGNLLFPQEDKNLRQEWGITLNPLIGTFGFLLPHKGILELLDAVGLLRREFPKIGLLAQCALHYSPISKEFEERLRRRIVELGLEQHVLLSTDFLPPEEAAVMLQLTDAVVLPYGSTAESSSAAVRFALGVQRPVITTSSAIFSDVASSTYQLSSNEPEVLAEGIRAVLIDSSLAEKLADKAHCYAQATSWYSVAREYARMLEDLFLERNKIEQRLSTGDPMMRLCELSNPDKWLNPTWLAIHKELETYAVDKHVFADQPEMGHRKGWEWTQTLYGLDRLQAAHPEARALGVGVGHEPLLYYLADRISQVIGTDLYGNEEWSQSGGKEADRATLDRPELYCPREYRRSRLRLMDMDGTRLTFSDDSFDFVWSLSSIEHFGGHENARRAIREMARVTKPGGIVVIATEYVIGSRSGKHAEYFDREDWNRYILGASSNLKLIEQMDYTLPPAAWLAEAIQVNTEDVHRVRRHIVLDDGTYQWTSAIAFFRKEP